MRGRRALLTASGLVVAGTVLPAGSAAAATPVTCGAHLTTNAKLTADLMCPADGGITLDAGVTLNLGGHRLAGPGSGLVTTATVRRLSVAVGRVGVSVVSGTVTVERSTFRGAAAPGQIGVVGFFGAFHVSDSTFDGVGVDASIIRDVSVTRSTIRNADTAMSCSEAGCSITDSRLERNRTAYSGFDAGLTMRGNLIRDKGVGFVSGPATLQPRSSPDLVEGNRFVGNDVGLHLDPGATATVRGNRFTRNGRGVEAAELEEEFGGFRVLPEDNTLTRNGDAIFLPDAFLPTPTGFSLQGNTALRNTGWGIFAPRATDLGGNVARGNGRQPQCVGVAC